MKIKTLKELVAHCEKQGWTMTCQYSGCEPDYKGTDAAEALEALEACDEMILRITDTNKEWVGTALIVNDADMDPEEQIADYGGERLGALLCEEKIANT